MALRYPRLVHALLFCTALLAPAASRAVNLVSNPSFETYTNCPSNLSNLYIATPWDAPTTGRIGASCSIGPVGTVPNYFALVFTPQLESPAGTFLMVRAVTC